MCASDQRAGIRHRLRATASVPGYHHGSSRLPVHRQLRQRKVVRQSPLPCRATRMLRLTQCCLLQPGRRHLPLQVAAPGRDYPARHALGAVHSLRHQAPGQPDRRTGQPHEQRLLRRLLLLPAHLHEFLRRLHLPRRAARPHGLGAGGRRPSALPGLGPRHLPVRLDRLHRPLRHLTTAAAVAPHITHTHTKYEKYISTWNDEVKRNFQRNMTLIDLTKTPEELKNQIRLEYNNAPHGDRSKLLNYFMIYKLRELTDNIGDF